MSNLLEQGEKWLAGMLHKHASTQLRYERRGASSTLCATIGRSVFEIADQLSSAVLRIESRDYLVAAEEFAATGLDNSPNPATAFTKTQGCTRVRLRSDGPGWGALLALGR